MTESSYWSMSGEAMTSTLINVNQLYIRSKWEAVYDEEEFALLEKQDVLAIVSTGFIKSSIS